MTSSFLLQQKLRDNWDDTYLRPYGECHPDYEATPIGNPYGVKMCVRRLVDGHRIGEKLAAQSKVPENGYFRGSVNLYDPKANIPTQEWNPDYYQNRRTYYEQTLLRDDYMKWPVWYNGTGLSLAHAPAQGRDTGHPYHQYGYSATPDDSRAAFGYRSAVQSNQSMPETKYDLTRGIQPYPLWKREQSYVGNNQSAWDQKNKYRII